MLMSPNYVQGCPDLCNHARGYVLPILSRGKNHETLAAVAAYHKMFPKDMPVVSVLEINNGCSDVLISFFIVLSITEEKGQPKRYVSTDLLKRTDVQTKPTRISL